MIFKKMEVNEHDGRFEQNAVTKGCERERRHGSDTGGAEHSVGKQKNPLMKIINGFLGEE